MPRSLAPINVSHNVAHNHVHRTSAMDDLDVSLVSSASISSPLLVEPDSGSLITSHAKSHHMDDDEPEPSAIAPEGAKHSYGPFTAYCFTVNYILGVGVLGMPHAFVQAGWALSVICLFVVTCMATLTSHWLTEVGHRAARHLHHQKHAFQSISSPRSGAMYADHRIEVNELVEMFIGRKARRFYEVLLAIYMIGALWSYTAVFSQSLADQIGGFGDHSYYAYLGFFAAIVLPLTCMEMTELKPLAIGLAIFRFVSIGLMMLTALVSMYSFPSSDLEKKWPYPNGDSKPYLSDMEAVRWPGLALVFPVSIYSQIFHHSIPGLAYPVTDKKALPKVFGGVLLTTFSLYAGLGILVGLYFGSAVADVCTLNWTDYTGSSSTDVSTRSGFASFVSYLIVLFPPIDIISAFPLNAITLANNIMSASIPVQLTTKRRYIIPFRLGAALIPIVGALFVSSLSKILNYTGCVGVMMAFLFPVVLQHQSQKMMNTIEFDEVNDHEHANGSDIRGGFSGAMHRFIHGTAAKVIVGTFSVVGLVTVIVLSIVFPS